MTLRMYAVTTKHDKGRYTITTAAQSAAAARNIVRAAEGCPDCAIVSVKRGRILCQW